MRREEDKTEEMEMKGRGGMKKEKDPRAPKSKKGDKGMGARVTHTNRVGTRRSRPARGCPACRSPSILRPPRGRPACTGREGWKECCKEEYKEGE